MKAIDGMLGLAIGDAMGLPIGYLTREELLKRPVTSMTGYGNYEIDKGIWSIDTALSLATLDSFTKNIKINYNDLMKRYCNWINKGQYSATGEVFDIDSTVKFSLMRYYLDELSPLKCGSTSITENGNGSIMRMFPVAYFCFIKNLNAEQTCYIAITMSSLTNAHPISCLGCYIYILYVINILKGNDKEKSYSLLRKADYSMFKKETLKYYDRILKSNISVLSIDDLSVDEHIVNTLESSLWVILNTNSYEESIIASINLGGDTNTLGAVTGSIAGLIYGLDNIPYNWLKDLKNIELLQKICSKFEASIQDAE